MSKRQTYIMNIKEDLRYRHTNNMNGENGREGETECERKRERQRETARDRERQRDTERDREIQRKT
jgi:hypothetical protein